MTKQSFLMQLAIWASGLILLFTLAALLYASDIKQAQRRLAFEGEY